MVNVNLAPGEMSLEEMIASTEDGVYVEVNKSWSIDDYRLNFQFSCEQAWEIKNGKRTRLLKNPVYSGKTPDFWRNCDAIGNKDSWQMWGWMSCGKGDPIQTMHVGHGCAPARSARRCLEAATPMSPLKVVTFVAQSRSLSSVSDVVVVNIA